MSFGKKTNQPTNKKTLWYLLGRNGYLITGEERRVNICLEALHHILKKEFYVVCETNKQCLKSLISIQMVSQWEGQGSASVVNHLPLEGPCGETGWCLYKSIGTWEKDRMLNSSIERPEVGTDILKHNSLSHLQSLYIVYFRPKLKCYWWKIFLNI